MVGRRAYRDSSNDSDDDNSSSLSSVSTAMSDMTLGQRTGRRRVNLDKCVEALYEKKGFTREKALSDLVDAFEGDMLASFVENKCITLLHQYINSIKRGSTKEICLASRAMGLLAVTIGVGSIVHEILEEAVPQLSQALKSGSDPLKKLSVLDCLAIITFVGANDPEETEKSMEIMWNTVLPKPGSNVGTVSKPTSAVLAAAISAWSFLLTTVSGWRLNYYDWKETISFLSTLLEKEDRSVRIAAGEAIALIFEIGRLEKVSREESYIGSFDPESNPKGFAYVESLRGKMLTLARDLSSEAGGKGISKKELDTQRDLFQDILTFLETGDYPEKSIKISNKRGLLKVSTWTQTIQLKFFKHFLGSGFLKHMQDNELLEDVFDLTSNRTDSLAKEMVTLEEIPKGDPSFLKDSRGKLTGKQKRWFLSPNSALNRGRTQMLAKHRAWAQERNLGHFGVDTQDN